ncbi:hypothetical protein K491DRAFT_720052 [Lophiostoma macrostomum CBS 122681]|uniref:Uncharacterized protein n=1 Tax=Lophiostoma macrostomum CBS 122681 TaxID=1314788 RepID=A0A6A6SY96_9PLEO|nr:hypothetical protein K491DRAFT_720052 [Lophiostoma macrostomum CBS 122681]
MVSQHELAQGLNTRVGPVRRQPRPLRRGCPPEAASFCQQPGVKYPFQLLQKELNAANKTIERLEIQLVSTETKASLREKQLLDDIDVHRVDAEHDCDLADLAQKEQEKLQAQAEVARLITNLANEHTQVLAKELVQIRGMLQG